MTVGQEMKNKACSTFKSSTVTTWKSKHTWQEYKTTVISFLPLQSNKIIKKIVNSNYYTFVKSYRQDYPHVFLLQNSINTKFQKWTIAIQWNIYIYIYILRNTIRMSPIYHQLRQFVKKLWLYRTILYSVDRIRKKKSDLGNNYCILSYIKS